MARNNGIDRTSVRNVNLTNTQISNTQRHNEREKESYTNPDIIPERTSSNVHFKSPTGSYREMFDLMQADKTISTRGLKEDAKLYGELIFDVNSAYFFNHGGYEFAKQFYKDAYEAAKEIVGGEQYILSAVMHADERNRAMSEALGQDVFHYHMHVVYVPVVEKQVLWTKRCKDPSLVGTVKETIMQVSSSKKWLSKPALDEQGNPILQKNGKPVLKKSYSVLQDDFYNAMRAKGYTDVERGERGSTEEHLTVTQFKVQQEQRRLEDLAVKVKKQEQTLHKMEAQTKVQRKISTTCEEIDRMGRKTLLGRVEFTQDEAKALKEMAKASITANTLIAKLKEQLTDAKRTAQTWKERYEKLWDQTYDYIQAVKRAPEFVKSFIQQISFSEKKDNHQRHHITER